MSAESDSAVAGGKQKTRRVVNQGKALYICILDQLNWKPPCGALIVHKYNCVSTDHSSQGCTGVS